ncbi:MAG TPA: transposase [Pseudonocardia sp.]|nr:transposase [Pseudonocardia sp.]
MILPGSWAGVLEPLRPVFRRRGTFVLFTVLATGMVTTLGRRSVVGMLAGARMAQQISFHAACRFFSHAVWDIDRLGLVVARMVVTRLLGPGEPILVVIDDTLFKRWGRHVHGAHWTHDGAAQGGKKIARGNRWVVAGIVVRLPFCTAPVCLPVLMRLWAGKGTTTPVELAAQLLKLLVAEFPGRQVHGVGDAAYHGKPLLVPGATWTTRLPANACLFDTAPPRTGRRGRPALKGRKLGRPTALAAAAADKAGDTTGDTAADGGWRTVSVYRYGRTETVALAEWACIWYGSFGNRPGRCVLLRELGSANAYDLALFTLDPAATPGQVVERYAIRWSIEPANAVGKQQMGVGQARNRVRKAVERTVPFGMLVQSLVVIWYALHGHHPDDVSARRLAQPWYQTKTEPSFEDMITKLRKTLIVARFTPTSPGQPNPDLLHDYALACAAAAA